MAATSSSFRPLLLITFLLLSSTLSHSFPFTLSNYQTLLSLSHSLTSRVATLRAARGDHEGAARARNLARNIESGLGLGFYRFAWNVGWDYLRNYAWRDTMSFGGLGGVVSDLNELLGAFGELRSIDSDVERMAWVSRNYRNALRVSKSLFGRLLHIFQHSGPLREVLETLQREVMEGELLKDCLELGANDLEGLIQVVKDTFLQYASTSSQKTEL